MYLIFKAENTRRNAYWDSFLSITRRYPDSGLFLEIGAANIDQVRAHQGMYRNLVGLDLCFNRLPQCVDIKLVNADAQHLPFKENSFDGVISHHVIEHVGSDEIFLGEIRRTLRKGGFAVIGTPNRRRLASVVEEAVRGKKRFPWHDHLREYTPQELEQLARKVGFREFRVTSRFLGIHLSRAIIGFSCVPGPLQKWCNFLFLEVIK